MSDIISNMPHMGVPHMELKQPTPPEPRQERFISTNATDLLFVTLKQQHEKLMERVDTLALDLATLPTPHEAAPPPLDTDALREKLIDTIATGSRDIHDALSHMLTAVNAHADRVLMEVRQRVDGLQARQAQLEQNVSEVRTSLSQQSRDTSALLGDMKATVVASRDAQQQRILSLQSALTDSHNQLLSALHEHATVTHAKLAAHVSATRDMVTQAQVALLADAADGRRELTSAVGSVRQGLDSLSTLQERRLLEASQRIDTLQSVLKQHSTALDDIKATVAAEAALSRDAHQQQVQALHTAVTDLHTRTLTSISEHTDTLRGELATHATETRGIVAHLQAIVLSETAETRRELQADMNAITQLLESQQAWREDFQQHLTKRLDGIHHDTFLQVLKRLWARLTSWRHK